MIETGGVPIGVVEITAISGSGDGWDETARKLAEDVEEPVSEMNLKSGHRINKP